MKHAKSTAKVCSLLLAFVAVLAVVAGRAATAEKSTAEKKPAPGFSFAVYGDSRSMMYLPGNSDQKEEATKLLVDMFDLVLTVSRTTSGSATLSRTRRAVTCTTASSPRWR